jgi:L-rhamnose mutarotase
MERMGQVIRLQPEVIAEYKRIHAAVWPEVLAAIAASNIRNYTIFLKEPENLLFATAPTLPPIWQRWPLSRVCATGG